MRKIDKKELKELFYRIKNGDKETATEELYNKYHNIIYGIAFSILKNKDDAEDAMQNVFIKIYNLNTSLVPESKESTWLYTVAKNEAIEIIRKKKEGIDLEDIYEIGNEDNDLDEIIDEISFNDLINKLSNKEKEIISLKIISNLSFREIANLLGEPIGTIKWKYYTSIYRIKTLLGNLIMSILAFLSGELLFQNKRSSSINQMNEDTVLDSNTTSDATNKENSRKENMQIENSFSEESKNKQDGDIIFETENITNEVQIVQDTHHNINYLKMGTLGISAIFLIATIITLIFIKKSPTKSKEKNV